MKTTKTAENNVTDDDIAPMGEEELLIHLHDLHTRLTNITQETETQFGASLWLLNRTNEAVVLAAATDIFCHTRGDFPGTTEHQTTVLAAGLQSVCWYASRMLLFDHCPWPALFVDGANRVAHVILTLQQIVKGEECDIPEVVGFNPLSGKHDG